MHYFPHDIAILIPEIILTLGGLLVLLYGAIAKKVSNRQIGYLVIAVLCIALFFLNSIAHLEQTAFGTSFETNYFVVLAKYLILITVIANVFISLASQYCKSLPFEVFVIMLFASVGMLLLVSANDLLVLYLGLELMSLSLYVLVAYMREDIKASEAALKYFILGALASGFYLFGSSIMYGFTGSINFDVISEYYVNIANSSHSSEMMIPIGFLVGVILVLITFCFKMSAAPFHMWTPDVYQGSPLIITSFLATAPKIAIIFLFIKMLYQPLLDLTEEWQQIIIFAAIASMLVGSLGAIMQQNIKRMLAYSTIGHIGFILLGISLTDIVGIYSAITYLIIYIIMTVTIFALLLTLQAPGGEYKSNIQQLSGLGRSNPYIAFAITVIMFSMAGIPPLAGFFAKFYVLLGVIKQEMYFLAIIAVIFTTISSFYYLRIVKIIYFDEQNHANHCEISLPVKILIFMGIIFNVLYVLMPELLTAIVEKAAFTAWG
jgi:NADH-quinone oxidoreductase subunit N